METSLEGVVTQGRALARFLPQGYATPTWIHLVTANDEEFTVVIHPVLGEAQIVEGYVGAQ